MKPTLRFKQRYILFGLVGRERDALDEGEIRDFIFSHFISFFGEEGFASLAFKLISYDAKKKRGVIRCERSRTMQCIGALALISSMNGKEARLESLRASGTIRALLKTN